MSYNQETDKLINKGDIIADGVKIAEYVIYKSKHNIDRNYSNIDIIPIIDFELTENVGNSLSWNFDDYKLADILIAFSNDWTALKDISKTIFENVKSIYNYFQLNDDIIKSIVTILDITLGEHEKSLYNEPYSNTRDDMYTFSILTFQNNCIYALKQIKILDGLTDKEIIAEIVRYYMRVFISCCIECNSNVDELYC